MKRKGEEERRRRRKRRRINDFQETKLIRQLITCGLSISSCLSAYSKVSIGNIRGVLQMLIKQEMERRQADRNYIEVDDSSEWDDLVLIKKRKNVKIRYIILPKKKTTDECLICTENDSFTFGCRDICIRGILMPLFIILIKTHTHRSVYQKNFSIEMYISQNYTLYG